MSLYSDEIEKINYYKERIIEAMAKNGEFPNDMEVKKRLDAIDNKLSIFQYRNVMSGDLFDATAFNEYMTAIYTDLTILYKLAYQCCVNEFEQIKSYADSHLIQLERMAKRYMLQTETELSTTSLGKTIFFQTSGFNIKEGNTVARIELGDIEVSAGSKLACLFEGTEISPSQVVFSFEGGGNCSPYSYNRDLFTVKGEPSHTNYEYSTIEHDLMTVAMDIDKFVPDRANSYIIYAGKNQYTVMDSYGNSREETLTSLATESQSTAGKITFYIVGGKYANFEFSKMPDSKNFEGTEITNMQSHQKITMSYSKGFSFNVHTDGVIYAARKNGIFINGRLYYPNATTMKDFLVEEYSNASKVTYNTSAVISGLLVGTPLRITSIAIKEMPSLEGVRV